MSSSSNTSFSSLLASSAPSHPLPPLAYPADYDQKVNEIIAHFNVEGYSLPVKQGDEESRSLSEREMMFMSRETLLRFLTAVKGDKDAAIQRLEKTLIWRRTENIDDIEAMAADCEPESRTGKNMVLGYTQHGRPIVYFFPNRNTTPVERRRAVHAVFMMERAADLMSHGVTNTLIVFSFGGKKQGPPTSVSVARESLHILSEYYPERLAMSHFVSMPFVVKIFVNLMWPFVDSNTKKKVKFDMDIVKEGDAERGLLLKECGGDLDLPYNHEEYWSAMMTACKKRREEDLQRWRALGEARVGQEEIDFKGPPTTTTSTEGLGQATSIEAEDSRERRMSGDVD